MSAQSDPRAEELGVDQRYYYRRSLSVRELLAAVGAAVGAALVTFYIARLVIQRTPLRVESSADDPVRLGLHRPERSSLTARNIGRR
jgi:hypothetical protein